MLVQKKLCTERAHLQASLFLSDALAVSVLTVAGTFLSGFDQQRTVAALTTSAFVLVVRVGRSLRSVKWSPAAGNRFPVENRMMYDYCKEDVKADRR